MRTAPAEKSDGQFLGLRGVAVKLLAGLERTREAMDERMGVRCNDAAHESREGGPYIASMGESCFGLRDVALQALGAKLSKKSVY